LQSVVTPPKLRLRYLADLFGSALAWWSGTVASGSLTTAASSLASFFASASYSFFSSLTLALSLTSSVLGAGASSYVI
tara:strand:- start:821 stop:1054 length:234 start_codon:yes stop_codon:yes gene_type:complete